mmetsp:Transcript_26636/g.57091  ORF Transcript_26636/g.57091 Transcript_26636/m.57091 type:complete len:239 (+) Transcript_26636:593-1309(+)
MLRTPASSATSARSSVHTSTTSSSPEYCFITSFTTGTVNRQGPHQGAVKKTRTGRERSFERTLSANCLSVSIIFPPDLAIPSCVMLLLEALALIDSVLDGVAILVVCEVRVVVVVDGTKALAVVKTNDAKRTMKPTESIDGIFRDGVFDRERSFTNNARRCWVVRDAEHVVHRSLGKDDEKQLLIVCVRVSSCCLCFQISVGFLGRNESRVLPLQQVVIADAIGMLPLRLICGSEVVR